MARKRTSKDDCETAPRGKVHCYKNCTNQVARMLALFTPGTIEGYFDFGLPLEDGSIPSEACIIERMNAIGPRFNVTQVKGPSPFSLEKWIPINNP